MSNIYNITLFTLREMPDTRTISAMYPTKTLMMRESRVFWSVHISSSLNVSIRASSVRRERMKNITP